VVTNQSQQPWSHLAMLSLVSLFQRSVLRIASVSLWRSWMALSKAGGFDLFKFAAARACVARSVSVSVALLLVSLCRLKSWSVILKAWYGKVSVISQGIARDAISGVAATDRLEGLLEERQLALHALESPSCQKYSVLVEICCYRSTAWQQVLATSSH